MEAQNIIVKTKQEFDKLPLEVKKLFNNSAEQYVSEMGTKDFIDKLSPFNEEIKKKQEKKQPEKPKTTGDPKIDALIKERERAISEMRRLNDAIEDEKISEQIDHLEQTTAKIIDHVVAHPKKLPQISRFMSYYLPTTIKLLNAYDRMDSTGAAGDNISGTKERVEKMLDTLVQAYDNQFDALFGDEAMDLSTDITVLENLLRQQGFASGDKTNSADGSITLEL